jgi:hypothetical protein
VTRGKTVDAAGLTDAEARMLDRVVEAGSVTLHGDRLLAAGDWLPHLPVTALRLVGKGMLEFAEPTRLTPTERGRTVAALRSAGRLD